MVLEHKVLFIDQPLEGLEGARPWRLNLCASDATGSMFFVAIHDQVLIFPNIGHFPCAFDVEHTASLGLKLPEDQRTSINAIKTGFLGPDEFLVTVDDGGMVVLYSMKDLKRPPLVFDNSVSTWGIAMHQGTKRVAVSSNSHEITICTIQSLDLSLRQLTRLSGHSHNVPAVDFSHCGRFIVSGSIDGICRVWNAETGDVIASHSFVNLKWNWTVSYIKKAEIRISNEPPSAQTEEADPGVTPPLHPVVRNFGNLLRDMAQSPGDDDTGLDLSDSDEGVTTDPALYGDILSPSGSESYITASEDDRDSDWTSLHGTSVSDSSSSIHSLSPRDRFFSVTESQPDVLTPTADDETEDSLILRTTADDIYLMQVSSSKLVCVASIREVLVGWEDRYSYRGMNRLSMVEWIPELSLAVVVSQMGKVGLVEVLRHKLQSSDDYSLKVKTWLPESQGLHPILGLFVTKQISNEDPGLNVVTVNYVTHDGMISSYYVGTEEPAVSEVDFLQ